MSDLFVPITGSNRGIQRNGPLKKMVHMADGSYAEVVNSVPMASERHIGQVGGQNALPSASFIRPADVTAYASGDLVANSTVAGSVTPLVFTVGRTPDAGGFIRKARLRKSSTGLTGAVFRLHLYSSPPVCVNGDNAAWRTTRAADYIDAFNITMDRSFSDGAIGVGLPMLGQEVSFIGHLVYGLLEIRGAHTPVSGDTFTVSLEVTQN